MGICTNYSFVMMMLCIKKTFKNIKLVFVPGAEPEDNVAQQRADEENEAEPVEEAEREEMHTEKPKDELEKETQTPQPETRSEEEEKDTNQTEERSQNTTNEDECVQDEQNNGGENEDHKPEVKLDMTDKEGGQKQEANNFTNEENKSNEEPEMMEKPEDEEPPAGEVLKFEESFGQEQEKEGTSENSVNAEETRATPMEEENMIEEITKPQLENPEETSVSHENMDQNSETEKVNDEGLSGGEEVSAEEVRAEEEEMFDDESRNLRNNSEETRNDSVECVERNMEDKEIELKGSSVNEVKDEDVAGKDERSEERVEVSETEGEKEQRQDGVETDLRDGMEETKDQDPQLKEDENTEEGNKDEEKIKQEITEDKADQKELNPTVQTSEEKADDDVGKREEEQEEELLAEKNAELKDEQKSGHEGQDTEDVKHEEALKENESLKETEVEENEVEDMSEGAEERTSVGGVDAEMQKRVMEQEEDNKEEQKDNSDPTVYEPPLETIDGPELKSGKIKAENGVEIDTADQEELDKKEEAGPEESEETSETNDEQINRDLTKEEGVKDEQMDDDVNEKQEEDQREIQQETTEEEEEEQQKVGEEEIEQKQNVQQEATNEKVKDEQKDEMNIKPLISENSNNTVTEDEAPSEAKSPAGPSAGAESKPKDMNVDLESRGEEQSRAEDGNHIQSVTDNKEDKSVDPAEETRSVESSTSPSEESQPLERVLALKREEREAELIIVPQTDHEELVSNWVSIHQASNYFETFVEPLDEIKTSDGGRTVYIEIEETIPSPKESHRNKDSSEMAKDEQISLPVNTEHKELEDMRVENFNMETEALGAEGQNYPSSSNPSEEEVARRQMNSEQTLEDQEDVAVNNIMNISTAPLMKIEISQDS